MFRAKTTTDRAAAARKAARRMERREARQELRHERFGTGRHF